MTATDPKLPPPKAQPALPPSNGHAEPPDHSATASHENGHGKLPPAPTTKGNPIVRGIIWLVVLTVLAVVTYFGWQYYQKSQKPPEDKAAKKPIVIPVVAEKSRIGDLNIYIERVGSVAAYNTVVLKSRVDGQLDKVAFTEGQTVSAGDVLFKIDPRPYEVQLMRAQGQLAKDEATLNNAKADLARYEAASEAISKQQLDTARAAVLSAEGVVKADQGAIAEANLNIEYCTIKAPITGRMGLRRVDQGNMVRANDTEGLATITQLQPIAVLFSPPQDDLMRVQKAMTGTSRLAVEAWDKNNNRLLASGHLEALENQIDPTTGTFRSKAVFDNNDNALFPNQFVNVRLLVDTLNDVVLVPVAAVQQSPTSAFVYVVKSDNKVELREIKTGPSENGFTVVENGLKEGETVVTSGIDKLKPGTEVSAQPPGGPKVEPATATSPTGTTTKHAAKAEGHKKP
jgi:multidrug efflux system membrane fusion protein